MHPDLKNKAITIAGQTVLPGQKKLIKIDIARLPSGTLIDVPVHVFNSKQPGPTLLLQAGLHGDEINGVETLRRMLEQKLFNLKKGAVIVVPILNIFGFIHFSREVPDGKDVNRSFPGVKKGSLASRIAYYYTHLVLSQADYAIDLHTGGAQRNNYPQIRYSIEDPLSKILAQQFNAPFYFASNLIKGSFRKQALAMQKTSVVFEGGESMRYDPYAFTIAQQGILNIMQYLGMSKNTTAIEPNSIELRHKKWIRAPRAGMFIPAINNGQAINKGQVIGKVADTFAQKSKAIKAPFNGYVFCINNQAVVNRGDALFHLGYS